MAGFFTYPSQLISVQTTSLLNLVILTAHSRPRPHLNQSINSVTSIAPKSSEIRAEEVQNFNRNQLNVEKA